jgi:hypothetical protein
VKRAADAAARTRCWSRELLEEELGRVHAREFARLLCRAALLRLPPARGDATWLRELGLEDEPVAWRCAARRAQRLAEIDGFELAGLLRHALARPLEEWDSAAALSAAALEIDRSESTCWQARVLACLRSASRERAALAALVRARPRLDLPARGSARAPRGDQPW